MRIPIYSIRATAAMSLRRTKPSASLKPPARCWVAVLLIITWTSSPTRIADGVWVTGAIPRNNNFEDTGGPFFLDPECQQPDLIEGDQALWVHTAKGIVVILGCAHAGVVNTLDYIARLTGVQTFHAVVGGMHLVNAEQMRLLRTLEALKHYRIQKLGPCHCTGSQAEMFLEGTFEDEYLELQPGMRITFG